jgi:ligand-binding SRPBCC domain-containing protein
MSLRISIIYAANRHPMNRAFRRTILPSLLLLLSSAVGWFWYHSYFRGNAWVSNSGTTLAVSQSGSIYVYCAAVSVTMPRHKMFSSWQADQVIQPGALHSLFGIGLIHGSSPIAVNGVVIPYGPGDRVTWEGKHFGVTQRLSSQITQFQPPSFFQDRMTKGAFRSLEHDHFFEPQAGGTLMVDVLSFAAPLGPLGWIAERLFLGNHLRRFLVKRGMALKQLAERGPGVPSGADT